MESILRPPDRLENYYSTHAKIYDWTRWSFLFGRKKFLRNLPFRRDVAIRVLEVGCGTGHNLAYLAKEFPNAQLLGLDLSEDMLRIAHSKVAAYGERVQLLQAAYGTDEVPEKHRRNAHYDLLIFSYCLTMVEYNEPLMLAAKAHLKPSGMVAVVDFDSTRLSWFRRWMMFNHVTMNGAILPFLQSHFTPIVVKKKSPYFGVWSYFIFRGQPK